jgi:hypothetical protein
LIRVGSEFRWRLIIVFDCCIIIVAVTGHRRFQLVSRRRFGSEYQQRSFGDEFVFIPGPVIVQHVDNFYFVSHNTHHRSFFTPLAIDTTFIALEVVVSSSVVSINFCSAIRYRIFSHQCRWYVHRGGGAVPLSPTLATDAE